MGSRGSSGRESGGGGVGPGDILSERSLISEREGREAQVDRTLESLRSLKDEYGEVVGDLNIAELSQKKQDVLGFSDGTNISINERFFNARTEDAYTESVKSGYHPPTGDKTALQAVVAHEMGHNLTQAVAQKLGLTGAKSMDSAATRIVNEARPQTGHRGVVQMANKISRYATVSNAEAVAEAVSDVYCNGSKARAESKAIVSVVRKYLNR